jgi:hypothetical protein
MKSAPPEFLFDAIATTALPCGNREVTANPVKVKLEAPKKAPVPRREMTWDEHDAVKCLKEQVTYPPASWDKRFARELLTTTITEKESAQVWRLFHRYRRQIKHWKKAELLEVAAKLAAPDSRKLAKEAEERRCIEATKNPLPAESVTQ